MQRIILAALFCGVVGCGGNREPRPLNKMNFHELSVLVEIQNRRIVANNESIATATKRLVFWEGRIKDATNNDERKKAESERASFKGLIDEYSKNLTEAEGRLETIRKLRDAVWERDKPRR